MSNHKESDPVITTTSVTASVLILLALKSIFSFLVWKWAEWVWKLIFGEKKVKNGVNTGVPAESSRKEANR